jgi:hypothetical protein
MTDAKMLWRTAMERMALLNKVMSHPSLTQTLPSWKRHELRAIAESRLSDYFNHVERMIARDPAPNTPADHNRIIGTKSRG